MRFPDQSRNGDGCSVLVESSLRFAGNVKFRAVCLLVGKYGRGGLEWDHRLRAVEIGDAGPVAGSGEGNKVL